MTEKNSGAATGGPGSGAGCSTSTAIVLCCSTEASTSDSPTPPPSATPPLQRQLLLLQLLLLLFRLPRWLPAPSPGRAERAGGGLTVPFPTGPSLKVRTSCPHGSQTHNTPRSQAGNRHREGEHVDSEAEKNAAVEAEDPASAWPPHVIAQLGRTACAARPN